MAYPKVVAFDLDGTIWSNWLDPNAFGRNGRVGRKLEDNLEIVGNQIRDKRNWSQQVRVSNDIYWILTDLVCNGVKIAVVSRNMHKGLCNRAMWLIKMRIPATSNERPLTDLIKYSEIYNSSSKQTHFEKIKGWSHAGYHEMLFFDDQASNSDVELWQGVTFQRVSNGNYGVTTGDYRAGLDIWRRNQSIRRNMPGAGPDPLSNRRQIGWVGTDRATAELYRQGRRRPRSTRPSRWGWGLYVADDPAIAAVFAKWLRERDTDNHYICKVFVRDFEVFKRMDKVWVPESGLLPGTDINRGDAHAAEAQMRRDEIIANSFGVRKPYILFSRHHWMDLLAVTWRKNHTGRFSEMVLYPQVQDALFYGEPWKLSDAQSRIDGGLLPGFDFRHNLANWGIKWNSETTLDFKKHNEDFR